MKSTVEEVNVVCALPVRLRIILSASVVEILMVVVVPSVAAVYTDEVSLPKPMIVYSVVSISNGSSKRYNALELSFTSGAVSDERASPKRFVKCNDSITPLNSPPFPPKNK